MNKKHIAFIYEGEKAEHALISDFVEIYLFFDYDAHNHNIPQKYLDCDIIMEMLSTFDNETELGKLMYDFSCTDPKDMYYKILADRVRYFKEDEEGVLTMCREMENMRKAERIEIAKRMLASGKLTYEDIAAFTDLTLEEIKALAVQKTA